MHWCKRIKDLRIDHDLTLKQLAQKLEISERTLARYENGVSKPTVDVLIQLALYFNVSVDYICGMTEERYEAQLHTKEDIAYIIEKLYQLSKKL